jgi:vacuolar-type H+-ATPase subunit I/STV1
MFLSAVAVPDRRASHRFSGDYQAVGARLRATGRAMATAKDAADLAHMADTVTALVEQLAEHREVQQNILAVLNKLLETSQAQSEMLAEILGAASEEAGPSPVAQALEALAARVQQMDENQTSLIALVAALPEAIGRQFETSLKDWSATTVPQH